MKFLLNKKYKYIHILWHNEIKFMSRIVQNINGDSNVLLKSEHYCVTPYIDVYNALKIYGNISFVQVDDPESADVINQVAPYCKWIILHDICRQGELLRIKPWNLKKILWRTWGWRTIEKPKRENSSFLRFILRYFKYLISRYYVEKFACIGIANTVDYIDISEKFPKQRNLFLMPYHGREKYNTLQKIKADVSINNDKEMNILIGHSGYPKEHHLEILKSLEHFKEEHIRLFFPLSYGRQRYIDELKKYIINEWGDKAVIIDKFMDYENYAKLLKLIDIAIFDTIDSCALGNIAIVLFFNKKIFLNSDGVIKKAFIKEKIPFSETCDIFREDFSSFVKPIDYVSESWKTLSVRSFQENENLWSEILKKFN